MWTLIGKPVRLPYDPRAEALDKFRDATTDEAVATASGSEEHLAG
jgi:hypothetical protein